MTKRLRSFYNAGRGRKRESRRKRRESARVSPRHDSTASPTLPAHGVQNRRWVCQNKLRRTCRYVARDSYGWSSSEDRSSTASVRRWQQQQQQQPCRPSTPENTTTISTGKISNRRRRPYRLRCPRTTRSTSLREGNARGLSDKPDPPTHTATPPTSATIVLASICRKFFRA